MRHIAKFTQPPKAIPRRSTPAGAVNGNGDTGIVWSDIPGGVRINVSKCDFWKALPGNDSDGGIKVIGGIDILNINTENYYVEQRMDEGEIVGTFGAVRLKTFVCAVKNIVLIKLSLPGTVSFVKPSLWIKNGCSCEVKVGTEKNVSWGTRCFAGERLKYDTAAALALARLSVNEEDGRKTYTYALSVVTNHDTDMESYREEAIGAAKEADFDKLYDAHKKWWSDFYGKSGVELYDREIENSWYASQYILACCARNVSFPPGLYGNFITNDAPGWHGDLHLNYNYQAPFYALCSSNHAELTDCFLTAPEDFVPQGKYNAHEYLDCRGIYFPVGIGPKGLNTSCMSDSPENGELFLGQKSNAAYCAVIAAMRWYATYDVKYAREHIYPFMREVADFWEDYLKFENDRYVIYDDAVHEVPYYKGKDFEKGAKYDNSDDFNNLLSLGLVRMVFGCMLSMSEALDTDSERRDKWEHILNHISDFPTCKRIFKTVFRYTERGLAWNDSNSLCIQHIYPAGQIGLDSDAELLETARNTYFALDRSLDDNGSCSYLPCGARLGASPKYLTDALRKNIKKFMLPNMLFNHAGGCIEHSSTVASTVNEMLLQGHEGVVRLFPVWDMKNDASFKNLRADGAFLVSSSVKDGEIGETIIVSEAGRELKLQNPFDGGVRLRVGESTYDFYDGTVSLETKALDVITVEKIICEEKELVRV